MPSSRRTPIFEGMAKVSMNNRIHDLILAVRDVAPAGSGGPVRSMADANEPFRELFKSYLRDLAEAKQTAESWWQSVLDIESARIGDRREAEINVKLRRPAGSAAHPRIIHTLRYYWLACSSQNKDLPPRERVAPEAFVLLWLEEAGERDLAEFIASIPYWPLGMDENGNWI